MSGIPWGGAYGSGRRQSGRMGVAKSEWGVGFDSGAILRMARLSA